VWAECDVERLQDYRGVHVLRDTNCLMMCHAERVAFLSSDS